ncbi:TIGR00730 family Rossman fold protein [Streptomyces sp. NBC_01614]
MIADFADSEREPPMNDCGNGIVPLDSEVMCPVSDGSSARHRRVSRQEDLLALLSACDAVVPQIPNLTWIGDLQQGDGGKGAMVDRLAPFHHIIVRVQGGENAGHTTSFINEKNETVVLKNHLIPSGLRHPGTVGVITGGVLVNPEKLLTEIDEMDSEGFDVSGRIFLSDRAHLVLPMHRLVDHLQEANRGQEGAIGTTKRGIGPANVSRANRTGVRVCDLEDMETVRLRLQENARLFGLPSGSVHENYAWLSTFRDKVLAIAVDSVRLLEVATEEGYSILFEGAQGPLIDIDHGNYPFVTTCPTTFHAVGSSTGIDSSQIHHRIGVLKTYQTMVGNGAFVTEDTGALGDRLRTVGKESGTTTGRPRRCGWLDLPHALWASRRNKCTSVALTKLDVLDEFSSIGVCTGYAYHGEEDLEFRPDEKYLSECTPIYRFFPGWLTSTNGVARYSELPVQAQNLVDYISDYLNLPVSSVTTGPRDQDILVRPGGEIETIYSSRSSRRDIPVKERVVVFCGAAEGGRPEFQQMAAELGIECAKQGISVVYGGGGSGIMGSLADAVLAAEGEIIGVTLDEPIVRELTRSGLSELICVPDMHDRGLRMQSLADAFIVLPGGYGTFQELLYTITSAQLGLHRKPIVLLDDTGYFEPFFALLEHVRCNGFIDAGSQLAVRATTVKDALRIACQSSNS